MMQLRLRTKLTLVMTGLVLLVVAVLSGVFAAQLLERDALVRRMPDVVFLDIGLEVAGATECIGTLGTSSYRGQVQLTSTRGLGVLAQVKSIGEQQHLHMLPVLSKPFETSVIMKVLQDLKLGQRPALAGRVDLGEALANGWIEFWYQPKIDLRKKQLVGVEAFARARHPVHGVLMPEAFVPAASDTNLVALSELALTEAMKASLNFAKLGVNLRMAVNNARQRTEKTRRRRYRASLPTAFRQMAGSSHRRHGRTDRQ